MGMQTPFLFVCNISTLETCLKLLSPLTLNLSLKRQTLLQRVCSSSRQIYVRAHLGFVLEFCMKLNELLRGAASLVVNKSGTRSLFAKVTKHSIPVIPTFLLFWHGRLREHFQLVQFHPSVSPSYFWGRYVFSGNLVRTAHTARLKYRVNTCCFAVAVRLPTGTAESNEMKPFYIISGDAIIPVAVVVMLFILVI